MNNKNLQIEKIKNLISEGYEKYKDFLSTEEQKICEMYLYEQGEYEEALTNLIAILRNHKVEIDKKTEDKFREAYDLMKLPYQKS